MLTRSAALLERELEKLCEKLDAMVEKETKDLVKRWNKMYPRYEFDIGCHDLCSFRYRYRHEDAEWVELDHYSPTRYHGELREVVLEADKFSDAYCAMDHRICPGSFGWISEETE